MRVSLFLSGLALLILPGAALAQNISADFVLGGGVRLGYVSTACGGGLAGAIRYNSASTGSIDFCNGATWASVGGSGGGGGALNDLSDVRTIYGATNSLYFGTGVGAASTAVENTAVGSYSMQSITTGNANTAFGAGTLYSITDGFRNTAFGAGAMSYGQSGYGNVAVGWSALAGAHTSSSSHDNVAVGSSAMGGILHGYRNVSVGGNAGVSISDGAGNTTIGYDAGSNITTGSNNIAIGHSAYLASASGNSQLNIGDTIYGDLSTDLIVVGTTEGQVIARPVSAQTIAAGSTIAANACGTVKQVTSAGAVATSTTNTFTAPAAANAGCCMDVVNTGSNNITLDANTSFRTIGGSDQVLGAYDAVRVCSNGTSWFQISAVAGNQ